MPYTFHRVVWPQDSTAPVVETILEETCPGGRCDDCSREFDTPSLFEGLYGGHTVCRECLWTHPGGEEID